MRGLIGAVTAVRGLLAGLAVAILCAAAPAGAACAPDRVELRGDWGSAAFTVEVADDGEERAQGLMFREALASSSGMLFIYERPIFARFWMKNTLIPLDMIFMTPDGVVTRVHPDAIPGDETPIEGGPGVRYVLEINGGLAAALGINPGSQMRYPGLGPDAAWPCDD